MGLAEKRIIKSFEEETLPKLVNEINDIAGKKIEFEVIWDQIAIEGQSHLYEECWPSAYFVPLCNALKSICSDDIGKEAIQGGFDKVVIKNETDNCMAKNWCVMENKTITLDHASIKNVDSYSTLQRTEALQTLLENTL